jgi:alkylhydroperoxidase/carboxymuconolactone decarboxylase family protein YurZ
MGRSTGNHSHYLSSLQLGITRRQIIEVMIQVGHYTGWPTLSNAVRQFTEILEEDKARKKAERQGKPFKSRLL